MEQGHSHLPRIYILIFVIYVDHIYCAILSRNKAVTSSDTYSLVLSRIVDGNKRRDATNCICCASTPIQLNPWFQLDLGKHYNVSRVLILGREGSWHDQHFQNLQILFESIHDGWLNVEMTEANVTRIVDYTPTEQKSTQYVSILLRDVTRNFTVCEMTVYGECEDGKVGDYCERTCHCDGPTCSSRTSGVCPSGTCLPGYGGEACDTVCQNGNYGSGCTETCGACILNATCHKENGDCPGECEPGYRGKTCKQPCTDGFYGQNCANICGHCHNGEPCNPVTGYCETGCEAGFQTDVCITECNPGTYGAGCPETCGNCHNGASCVITDGACLTGCMAGYQGRICKTECDNGKYGENCQTLCGKCIDETVCNKTTGVCEGGCSSGYQGRLCNQQCDDGNFGDYCERACHCDDPPCNKTTGVCPSGTCLPGYEGEACDTVCQNGSYGSGCTKSCGACFGAAICYKKYGSCPGLCAPGYKGNACKQSCADGFYGQNCTSACGHCHNGEPCNPVAGYCENGCEAGFQTYLCNTECNPRTYGAGCTETCGNCHDDTVCVITNGTCPSGCRAGYQGHSCKTECDNGTYGENCLSVCGNCIDGTVCNKMTGVCEGGCSSGYQGSLCDQQCYDGNFGDYCERTCHCDGPPCNKTTGVCPSGTCLPAYEGESCDTVCQNGHYGSGCTESCGSCFSNNICDKEDGRCPGGCEPGYRGNTCKQLCADGFYGQNCTNECGHCHNEESCNPVTGFCENGCEAGFQTGVCNTECNPGTYGAGCPETCGNCHNGSSCLITNGTCPKGCRAGYQGRICKTECDNGTYGEKCLSKCGNCIDGSMCNKTTGVCEHGCSSGYQGQLCDQPCSDGFYGKECKITCGNCKTTAACNKVNGECVVGCIAGYQKPLCIDQCVDGSHGEDCLEECGRCFNRTACNKTNGTCSTCEEGFTGHDCKLSATFTDTDNATEDPPVGAIVGAVCGVAAVISAAVIAIVIFWKIRKQKTNSKQTTNGFSTIDDSMHMKRYHTTLENETVVPKTSTSNKNASNFTAKLESSDHKDVYAETEYYGFLIRATDLKICQLWDYIAQKKKEDNLLFYQEFNRLKAGLQHPHDVALLRGNKPKTRYRGLGAYDHSRVPLEVEGRQGEYINASFINGIDKPKKFIASQGPTKPMIHDFWSMIWQQNSHQIIMLTNLFEMGKEKCLIYWPEEEEKVTYGNVTVSLTSESKTTDYVIRHLKISKDLEPARNVTQYHFRSWPDKDVPDSTWPLIKFWRTAMNESRDDAGPIIVHCSAGIGRTGTFIAMDNAFNQAKTRNKLKMLELVTTLRDQRVNMVQTKDQYVFLHEAVADALLFGTHDVWSRDFVDIYNFMTHMNDDNNKLRIQEQYNLIVQSVEDRKALENASATAVDDSVYSNIFIHNKQIDIVKTVDEYTPKSKSMVHVRAIGALLLPNCEKKDAIIICKSPTEETLKGVWSIIAEQNIKTVILLPDTSSPNYKKCSNLGASDKNIKSSFGITLVEDTTTSTYCQKHFTYDNADGPVDVSQFEYKYWPKGDRVPTDSRSMVDFLEVVLHWQQRLTATQPVLVHCSNGSERSGLVCVLLNELERMKIEQGHTNIVQSVKLMKERNENIIPNCEQYRYVYDTILETFNNGEVYANCKC